MVALRSIDATLIGEEQQPVVSAGHHEVLDDIVLSKRSASDAAPATALRPVQVRAGSFRVTTGGDRHDDILFCDEVLVGDLTVPGEDLGSTIIAVLADDLP